MDTPSSLAGVHGGYTQVVSYAGRKVGFRHAFVQNLRCGHYELGVEEPTLLRVVAAFIELAVAN
ncbi:MAG: hypothetical protein WCF33_18785 [Pseudonocardiaceae bacterium]